MQVAIVITLLSFCVTLAIPVPVDKSDQSRVERTLSTEALESELEDIENRVDAVLKKVKEDPTENSQQTTGIPPTPSTEKNVEIKVKSEEVIVVENTKKPDEIQVVAEKITKPSPKATIPSTNTGITPTPTASSTASIKIQVEKLKPDVDVKEKADKEKSENEVKVEKIVTSEETKTEVEVEIVPTGKSEAGEENTGDTVSVEKITVEKETIQKKVDGGENGEEEEEEKTTASVVVEKVEKKENENEEKVPVEISVEKVANDEEVDLAVGGTEKSDKGETIVSVEKISPDKKTEAKKKLPGDAVSVSVEKVTDKMKEKPDETVNGPNQIKVEKVANDEEVEEHVKERKEREQEEVDLEIGRTGDKGKAESDKKAKAQVEVVKETEKTEPIPDQVKVEKVSNDEAEENARATVEKVEQQEAEEEKDMQVKVEKLPVETSSAKETPLAVKVEKVHLPKVSDEADDNVEPKVKLTVEKLVTAEATMKPTVKTKPIDEEGKTHSKLPPSATSPASVVKVEKMTPEEENLKNSGNNVKAEVEKLPNKENGILGDASLKADSNQKEEEELEGEQEQELENEEETPRERKIALAFEKALEAERNKKENPTTEAVMPSSPIATAKMQTTTSKANKSGKGPENQTVKPVSETESKRGMSIEELELAALADKTLNDDDKEEKSPLPSTETPPSTTAPAAAVEKVVVVKEEKHPEITVTVTKEKNEKLLTEKETAQEEKKLKEELAKELKQEKTGPPPVIDKITKITDKPEKATTAEANPDNEETNNETKKEAEPEREIEQEQEQELEN